MLQRRVRQWLGLLLLLSPGVTAQNDTCAAPAETLSSSCGDLCTAAEPCLTLNATEPCASCVSNVLDTCQFQCLDVYGTSESSINYFVLLVPYGSYVSEEETAERAIDPTYDEQLSLLPDNTSDYKSVSNTQLTAVDTLNLSAETTYFILSGGSTFDYMFRSKVVQLELAPGLLKKQTQLTDIQLLNMDLKSHADNLDALLPPSTINLNLGNTLMYNFPSELSSLADLQALELTSNYISTVDADAGIEQLLVLRIRNNELKSFKGDFPYLTELDLQYNNLTAIPDVVYTYKKLQSLYMTSNQLKSPVLTTAQADFLAKLDNFDLTSYDFSDQPNCATKDKRKIKQLTVCIDDSIASSSSSSSSSSSADSSGSSTKESGSNNTVTIVAIVVGAVLLLAVLAAVVYCRWSRRNTGKHEGNTFTTMGTGGQSTISNKTITTGSIWTDVDLMSVQVRAEDIEDVRAVGGGAFGVVWLVRYRGTQLLASKRLRPEMVTHDRTRSFVEEIKLVSKLDHPHIVRFVGAAWSIESDLQALFEYMENGDLRTFLSAASMPRYWNKTKFDIAVNVVEALVYVHSFQPPLVHRDLKSRNVLISADMVAKLTDFGVSRYQSDNNTMTMGVGTSRWLAPEVIEGTQDYGPAADIFSFGVVLAELDTHAVPYDDAVGPNGHRLQDVAILQMVASGRLRPTFSRSVPPTVLELAQLCMAQEPSDRPSAAEVAYVLRSIQKEMNQT